MSLKNLKRLSKLKRLSEFTTEALITEFGIYESAIIELTPEILLDDDEPCVNVNPDVAFLQAFLLSNSPILLPCPDCKRELSFTPKGWGNPRCLENFVTGIAQTKFNIIKSDLNGIHETHNVFELSKPIFNISEKRLLRLNVNDLSYIQEQNLKDELISNCITQCRNYFCNYAAEIRRDFMCGLNASHRLFVNFRIYDPINPEDIEEYAHIKGVDEDDVTKAYEYLRDCLIIQKVGQYPSLADMQMFDVEKYRSVLGKESYRDLTRAIGLNASGIGCGSFLYLRRILERLVEEVHQDNLANPGWNEDLYEKSRFNERINLLENIGCIIIPNNLQTVKSKIYSVLSKGVHESTDDECMELFPYMQFVIEQILDEQIRKKENDQKIAKLIKKLESQ